MKWGGAALNLESSEGGSRYFFPVLPQDETLLIADKRVGSEFIFLLVSSIFKDSFCHFQTVLETVCVQNVPFVSKAVSSVGSSKEI